MMTLEQVRTALYDRRPSVVAKAIGVRVSTIIDIRNGTTANPSYQTIKRLSDYFNG